MRHTMIPEGWTKDDLAYLLNDEVFSLSEYVMATTVAIYAVGRSDEEVGQELAWFGSIQQIRAIEIAHHRIEEDVLSDPEHPLTKPFSERKRRTDLALSNPSLRAELTSIKQVLQLMDSIWRDVCGDDEALLTMYGFYYHRYMFETLHLKKFGLTKDHKSKKYR